MNRININNYRITYDETYTGGITILEVYKGKRNITKEMDSTLRARLVNEINEAIEDEREAMEWAARQDYLDEIEEKN